MKEDGVKNEGECVKNEGEGVENEGVKIAGAVSACVSEGGSV